MRDDEERVDGRELKRPREPGSDALLLLGLLRFLASHDCEAEREP
jgi:hypothetical protein